MDKPLKHYLFSHIPITLTMNTIGPHHLILDNV